MSAGKWFLQRLSFTDGRLVLTLARRQRNGRVPPTAYSQHKWYVLRLRYYADEDRFVEDVNHSRAEFSDVNLAHWLKQARGLYAHRDLLAPFFQRPTEGK